MLGDFMSEASQAFLNISTKLRSINQTEELQKQVDGVFKKLINFN